MSKVYFLPIEKIDKFDEFIEFCGVKDVIKENDIVAIKIHFGEKDNRGHVKPLYAKSVVKLLKKCNAKPFLTDANTIYLGARADAISHIEVAYQHGFTYDVVGCPVIIADGVRGNGYVEVDVNLKHFKKVKIAREIYYSDAIVAITHFKGHEITGFGGAIKNIGMGCAARAGKYEMHNNILPQVDVNKCTACGICIKWCPAGAMLFKEINNKKVVYIDDKKCIGCGECILSCAKFRAITIPWSENVKVCQEKIVEYAYGAIKNKPVVYINFLTFITKYCDCYRTKETPALEDIGVLVSKDIVAVDKASVDMVNKRAGRDLFHEFWHNIDWSVQLKYAEELHLGEPTYEVIEYS